MSSVQYSLSSQHKLVVFQNMITSSESLLKFTRSRAPAKLKNDVIIRLARGEKVERVPVWMLRQSGHYLPRFTDICNMHTLEAIYKNPKLACDMTILPLEHLDVDAVIVFADSFALLKILGIKVEPNKNGLLTITNPLMTPDDIDRLEKNVDFEQMLKPILDTIILVTYELDGRVPLIGFSLAPWTLFAYLIEGLGETKWFRAKSWLYLYQDTTHQLLNDLRGVVVDFLIHQYKAGAQVLMVIDSTAGALGKKQFMEFCYPQLKEIAREIKQRLSSDVTIILYTQGVHYALEELAKLDYQVIGIDWTIEPDVARAHFGGNKVLMGNLDPVALLADVKEIEKATKSMIRKFGADKCIANVGDGIFPTTNLANVKKFVDTVHAYKTR